ncbi:hypothetical protein LIP47_17810, partial [Eggerthella lenta]|nr:hypothetical protein [Eggerthella lenta]
MLMIISMVIMLLVGVGLIVYPTVADAWNRHVSSRAIAGYSEQVANLYLSMGVIVEKLNLSDVHFNLLTE